MNRAKEREADAPGDPSRRLRPGLTSIVLLGVAAAALLLYSDVLARLVSDWANDDNYSHGFLVPPLAAFFVWERRRKLAALPLSPSLLGLVAVVGSLAVLVIGILGAEQFLTRVSLIGVTVGGVVFLLGWPHLRVLMFPIAFLLLMIPIPSIIFNQIAFPLQLLASQFGQGALVLCQIPVLREGNVLHLSHMSLEVAEACSGIRSLISLLTLGIVYGYFTDSRLWVRTVIALSTVPVAIVSNGLRVAGTGVAASQMGPAAAEGFFHTFSGWLVFMAAFALLFIVTRFVVWISPEKPAPFAGQEA